MPHPPMLSVTCQSTVVIGLQSIAQCYWAAGADKCAACRRREIPTDKMDGRLVTGEEDSAFSDIEPQEIDDWNTGGEGGIVVW